MLFPTDGAATNIHLHINYMSIIFSINCWVRPKSENSKRKNVNHSCFPKARTDKFRCLVLIFCQLTNHFNGILCSSKINPLFQQRDFIFVLCLICHNSSASEWAYELHLISKCLQTTLIHLRCPAMASPDIVGELSENEVIEMSLCPPRRLCSPVPLGRLVGWFTQKVLDIFHKIWIEYGSRPRKDPFNFCCGAK